MTLPGGTLTLAPDLTIHRMGYGAMQLPGHGVWGPPRDRDEAIAVLRAAVEAGIDHIDTADFYGKSVSNELIRAALHPYGDELHIVTKVGATRSDDGGWVHLRTSEAVVAQVHDNLASLGLETIDVVNLRMGSAEGYGDARRRPVLGVPCHSCLISCLFCHLWHIPGIYTCLQHKSGLTCDSRSCTGHRHRRRGNRS